MAYVRRPKAVYSHLEKVLKNEGGEEDEEDEDCEKDNKNKT
jgi:hypothetical protein